MTDNCAALIGGIALLERAINYTLGSLHLVDAAALVNPVALGNPTPCRQWNLRTLLAHLDDSFTALHEAVDLGRVDLAPCGLDDPAADPTAALRARASDLLGAWTAVAGRPRPVSVGWLPLSGGIVTSTGALEIAVHGWDVARACGQDRPLPDELADELLDLAPLFVTPGTRPGRFDPPVPIDPDADPADRLLAFLGRRR